MRQQEAGEAGVAAARRQRTCTVLVAALNSLALVYAERGDTTAIELIEETLSHTAHRRPSPRAALRNVGGPAPCPAVRPSRPWPPLKQAVVIFAEIGDDLGGENAGSGCCASGERLRRGRQPATKCGHICLAQRKALLFRHIAQFDAVRLRRTARRCSCQP